MKVVIQRVKEASVFIENKIYNKINNGFVVLLAFHKDDNEENFEFFARKLVNLKLFEDNQNKMIYSLKDKNYEILLISQFTLYGTVANGNSVSWDKAMKYDEAQKLYDKFVEYLKNYYIQDKVKTGEFGAEMEISLRNYGPVTILIEK